MWKVLKETGQPLTAKEIAAKTGLKITDVFGALGWLGREGKIEVLSSGKKRTFRLTE